MSRVFDKSGRCRKAFPKGPGPAVTPERADIPGRDAVRPTSDGGQQAARFTSEDRLPDPFSKDVSRYVMQLKRKKKLFRNSEKMSLAEFHHLADPSTSGPTWRRWLHTGDETGQGSSAIHKPASTYAIPRTLSHVTHYSALPSIRRKGLDPSFRNASTGLNARSGTVKYSGRDDHLRAVYLGTHAGIGTSMETDEQTAEGGRVELRANLPWAFRIKHMRQIPAVVGNEGRGFDDAASGNTALSFAKIPSKYLSAVHRDDEGKETLHRLTSLVGAKGKEYDFRPFATRPGRRNDPLPSNQELLERQERLRALLEASRRESARMAAQPGPPTTDRPEADADRVNPQQADFFTALSARMQEATQYEHQAEGDGARDDEWDD